MSARFRTTSAAALAAISLVLGSCSAPVATAPAAKPVFYPEAPELPRIQFLTSFTGRKDVEAQSSFDRFVVGERPNLVVDKPYGVAMSDGKIYVCDSNGSLLVFDLVARSFAPLAGATGAGSLVLPINVTVDAEGRKFVADPGRGQIVLFDRKDGFVRAYGEPGKWRPVDAAPFERELYVVDSENGVVVVLDLESGAKVRTIGAAGDPAERLDRPTNIAIDREGYLYVTDISRFQVVKFDRDGHFRKTFGKLGDNFGHFARPKGIAVDPKGNLFAVDASFGNVQIFDPEGRLLLFFGGGGDAPGGLKLPAKVALDDDPADVRLFERYAAPGFRIERLLLVTSQFGDRRVNVYGFGRQDGKTYPSDDELEKGLERRRREAIEKLEAEAPPAASSAVVPEPAVR